ncbi:MAG: diacylglycerol/lipid kinase family protein [Nocardioidaceae bacterium]
MTRRFAVLVNPSSAGGRALAALPSVTAELERLGAPWRSVETRSLEHAAAEASAAAAAGETVAALGGDGLVRPIAGALRGGQAALAVLPGGRGNDFARVLGIPSDPVAAARVAVEGRERLLDVADCDGVPYLGIASLGLDSDAARLANEARLIRGRLVYLYAALRALAAWRPATFRLEVDGERHTVSGYSAAVANTGAYGGGMLLLPHAEPDDGKLDVLAIRRHSKLRFLRDLPSVFRGAHLASPNVLLWRGEQVSVDADRPFDVYADGDPIGRTPATMRVRPRCLRVLVPA